MKHKGIFRLLTTLFLVVFVVSSLSVTAFAQGGEEGGEPSEWIPEETTGEVLTPEGNMTLVDDISGEAAADKQFITVVSKSGNYFYIIIDRAKNGDNTVHFLNQVDEADLMEIMEDGTVAKPIVCACTEKCAAGSVNMACGICASNMTECMGWEPEPTAPTEPQEPVKNSGAGSGVVLLLLLAAGGAAAYFLVVKPRQNKNVPSNFDDFDLEDEEYLVEDDG